ncbi:MAG: PfkB family carbohydrate kinase [Candidatus Odinarchaeota archaeon]
MASSIFLVGNIVIDTKIAVDGLVSVNTGGPPSFSLNYLFNTQDVEKKTVVVISCNPVPFNQDGIAKIVRQLLEETGPHIFTSSRVFTRFTIDYSTKSGNGEDRRLFLTSFSGPIDPSFTDHLPEKAAVILSPVYQEITEDALERLATREDLFIAIDPQGFLRYIGRNQRIYPKKLPENFPFGLFSVIKFSIDDLKLVLLEDAELIARKMKKFISNPEKIILLTLGEKGAVAMQSDRIIQVDAIPSLVVDQTGAGDVFLSAFVNTYMEKQDLDSAIRIATAASSCLIERHGIRGVENFEKILQRSRGCKIKEVNDISISDVLRRIKKGKFSIH